MRHKMAYYKLIVLPDEVKVFHGIRSKVRKDCVMFNDSQVGGYEGLQPLYNHRGQFYLYLTLAGHFINADSRRKPEWSLTQSGFNLTSIYLEDFDFPQYGYGYPYSERFMGNGSENPLYHFRNDGYLIIMDDDRSELELIVIPDSRNMISSHYSLLLDGELDGEIDHLRMEAKPFYEYGYSKQ
jgi:hypothetical protein